MQADECNGIYTPSSKENAIDLQEHDKLERSGQACSIEAGVTKEELEVLSATSFGKLTESLPNPIQNIEESVSESESSIISQETNAANQAVSPVHTLVIGNKESRDINRFKIIVILILLVVAVVSSSCVFVFIKKSEQSQFEEEFHADALKILEAVRNSIDNTLMPLDNLAVSLVSHAKDQGDEWPFVTLEDYGVRIAKILPLTDAIWITVLPVVTPEKRLNWENYSRTHDDWVVENFAVQDTWELYFGPKNLTFDAEAASEVNGNFGILEQNMRYVVMS
jgi:hypothetical protein